MASDTRKLKIMPVNGLNKVHIAKENIRVISSGTSNRRTAIVPKTPVKRTPERKATQISVKENVKITYGLPQHPAVNRPVGGRPSPQKSLKLHRRAHVKKPSGEGQQDLPEIPLSRSPTVASPDRAHLTQTPEPDYFSPVTSAGASLQRYPSSIFEDYFDEPESAIDSPIHTIESLRAQSKRKSSFNGDDHDIWGTYWTDKMQARKVEEERPTLQRTTTLQVAELIRNRRKNAKDYRLNTMASCLEEEGC